MGSLPALLPHPRFHATPIPAAAQIQLRMIESVRLLSAVKFCREASPTGALRRRRRCGLGALRRGHRVRRAGLAMTLSLSNEIRLQESMSHHASAARVLSVLLDKLRAVSARGRRVGLAVVRTMTEKGGA
jgi:hypothetical protein